MSDLAVTQTTTEEVNSSSVTSPPETSSEVGTNQEEEESSPEKSENDTVSNDANDESEFTRARVEALGSQIRLTDQNEELGLDLFCYVKCTNEDSDFLKHCFSADPTGFLSNRAAGADPREPAGTVRVFRKMSRTSVSTLTVMQEASRIWGPA